MQVQPAGMAREQVALALVVGGEVGATSSHDGSCHRDGVTPDGEAGALVFSAYGTTNDARWKTKESELNTLEENRLQESGCVREDSIYLGELTHNGSVAKTTGLLPTGGKVLKSAEVSTTSGREWQSILDHIFNSAARTKGVIALHEMERITTFFIIKGAGSNIAVGAVRINESIRNRGLRRGAFAVAYHGGPQADAKYERPAGVISDERIAQKQEKLCRSNKDESH